MDIFSYVNALKVYKDFFTRRVEFITEKYNRYTKKTNDSISSVKDLLHRVGLISVFFSGVLWISIFMYLIFYFSYMLNVTNIRPVHLQFRSCDDNMGVCSFPFAHVQLMKPSLTPMYSEPHRIKLVMEIPETQMNKDMGMFMVCAQLRDWGGSLVSSSCRSAMLRHRCKLHHVMRTMVYAPFLVSDIHEEMQLVSVELFSDFQDNQAHPVTDVYLEVQSRFIQVLSCELHIEPHFTGLRYVMYNWPKICAFIGICLNFFLVSLMFILSWYQLQEGLPDYIKTKFGIDIKEEKTEDERSVNFSQKVKLDREDSFPFIDEEPLQSFEEFPNLEDKEEL